MFREVGRVVRRESRRRRRRRTFLSRRKKLFTFDSRAAALCREKREAWRVVVRCLIITQLDLRT